MTSRRASGKAPGEFPGHLLFPKGLNVRRKLRGSIPQPKARLCCQPISELDFQRVSGFSHGRDHPLLVAAVLFGLRRCSLSASPRDRTEAVAVKQRAAIILPATA
jgi:hypothetical protein